MLQRASKPSLGLHRQMACNHSQCKARRTEGEKEREKEEKAWEEKKTRGEKLITITNKEIYGKSVGCFSQGSYVSQSSSYNEHMTSLRVISF